jgi:hypothetical protein
MLVAGTRNLPESDPPPKGPPQDVIEAFDRERDEARELNRRHTEQVRASRSRDRLVHPERHRQNNS